MEPANAFFLESGTHAIFDPSSSLFAQFFYFRCNSPVMTISIDEDKAGILPATNF